MAQHKTITFKCREFCGFTLIELLVVIAIIGLLAGIVSVSVNAAREKSRDARRLVDIRKLQKVFELYYDDNGVYPGVGGTTWLDNDGCNGSYTDIDVYLEPTYLSTVPSDPKGHSHSCYYYQVRNSGQGYIILLKPELLDLDGDDGCPGYGVWYCMGLNWQ